MQCEKLFNNKKKSLLLYFSKSHQTHQALYFRVKLGMCIIQVCETILETKCFTSSNNMCSTMMT